jgi:hypothetical protein
MFVNRIKICPDLHKLQRWFSRLRQCLFSKLLRQWTYKMGCFLSMLKPVAPWSGRPERTCTPPPSYCWDPSENWKFVILSESSRGQAYLHIRAGILLLFVVWQCETCLIMNKKIYKWTIRIPTQFMFSGPI